LEDEQRRFIGQLDVQLNTEGVEQARRLQKLLDRMELSAVYCSDLSRTRQTATILAANKAMPVIPRKDLREISLGKWEGCTFAEIARCFPAEFKARGADIGYYRIPGGESFADCSKRVISGFYNVLKTTSGNIAFVGHSGVNRLLLCHILGMPLANLFKLNQDYGCLNVLLYNNSGFQVKLLNYSIAR
jgi:probable phosphoglycerate mutase